MFDEDTCAKRNNRMWRIVGTHLERAAIEAAKDPKYGPDSCLKLAEAAEVCFWQATGQGDFRGLERVLSGDKPPV